MSCNKWHFSVLCNIESHKVCHETDLILPQRNVQTLLLLASFHPLMLQVSENSDCLAQVLALLDPAHSGHHSLLHPIT